MHTSKSTVEIYSTVFLAMGNPSQYLVLQKKTSTFPEAAKGRNFAIMNPVNVEFIANYHIKHMCMSAIDTLIPNSCTNIFIFSFNFLTFPGIIHLCL